MKITTLYKYKRSDNKTTVSPIKPDCEYTEMHRLIAEEGSAITDGFIVCGCVDTEDASSWRDTTAEELMKYKEDMEKEN